MRRTSTDERLYAGPDLLRAAELSRLRHGPGTNIGDLRKVGAVFAARARARIAHWPGSPLVLIKARGTARDCEQIIEALYVGSGINKAYCFDLLFDRHVETVEFWTASKRALARKLGSVLNRGIDFVFAENVSARLLPGGRFDRLSMPAWIKQKIAVARDWKAQIRGLRRRTRLEVVRCLRKYGYECHITDDPVEHLHFFRSLYLPYIRMRFGTAAQVVNEQRFLAECRRGHVLQLVHRGTVVAATLVRRIGSTMSAVWTGRSLQSIDGGLHGVTDVQDYFALLFSYLNGCRWLDLGPSRPDLCDGSFRYKAKWGARATLGYLPPPMIHWSFRNHTEKATAFLRRHVFVTLTRRRRLTATIFLDDERPDAQTIRQCLERHVTPGLRDYRLVTLHPANHGSLSLRHIGDSRITIVPNPARGDLIRAYYD